MKLKELSEKSGISDRTIRYYISDGVFVPEKYTENYSGRKNYDYTENDLIRLEQIALLRKYDFSIKEIKSLFDNELDIQKVLSEHIEASKKASEAYGENILRMEQTLNKKPKNAFELCNDLSNPVLDNMPIPTIDEQNGHKLMLSRWKKEDSAHLILMTVFILLIFVLGLGSQKSFPDYTVTVKPEGIPEDTEYIDLLINIPLDERFYTDNAEIDLYSLDEQLISFSKESEIYNFNDHDYRSYSLHYKRALPVTLIKRDYGKHEYVLWYDSEFLSFSPAAKIAYVSKDGSVLSTTNLSTAKSISYIMDCEGVIADGEKLKPERTVNLSFVLVVQLFAGFTSVAISYWTKRHKIYEAK